MVSVMSVVVRVVVSVVRIDVHSWHSVVHVNMDGWLVVSVVMLINMDGWHAVVHIYVNCWLMVSVVWINWVNWVNWVNNGRLMMSVVRVVVSYFWIRFRIYHDFNVDIATAVV
jgi:hypothetical protein